jgi:hypothetical protein
MLPSKPKPPPRPLKIAKPTFANIDAQAESAKAERIAKARAAGVRVKLYVGGVAAALGLTESSVRMRVHRKQWELIPEPEATREIGARYYWYEDNVLVFKKGQK